MTATEHVEIVADTVVAPAIADVAAATFPLACPPTSPRENVAGFIRDKLSAARFEDYITSPDSDVLIARDGRGGPIVGYALVHHTPPTDPDVAAVVTRRPASEVSKCYVLPQRHAHRIDGRAPSHALMRAALDAAVARRSVIVWLGVNQENLRAQRFYEKMGFARVGVKRFDMGGPVLEHDFVYAQDLDSEHRGRTSGG